MGRNLVQSSMYSYSMASKKYYCQKSCRGSKRGEDGIDARGEQATPLRKKGDNVMEGEKKEREEEEG